MIMMLSSDVMVVVRVVWWLFIMISLDINLVRHITNVKNLKPRHVPRQRMHLQIHDQLKPPSRDKSRNKKQIASHLMLAYKKHYKFS